MTDLVGKTKYSINYDIWGAPTRSGSAGDDAYVPDLDEGYKYGKMTFLRYGDQGYVNKDTLKIAIGKAWSEDHVNPWDSDGLDMLPALGNDWGALALFYGRPLKVEVCALDGPGGEYPGFTAGENPPPTDNLAWLYMQAIYQQKISICVKDLPFFTKDEMAEGKHVGNMPTIDEWAAFIKLGLTTSTKTYYPIVSGPDLTNPLAIFPIRSFNDHYYKSVEPFSQKELASKQPFGKSAQVSIKTYYNKQLDTASPGGWEDFVAKSNKQNLWFWSEMGSEWQYDNALPTPYGFLRLMLNKFETKDLYESPLGPNWAKTAFKIGDTSTEDRSAFVHYPYELLMTLFGRIPEATVNKLVKTKPKEENAQEQFEDYFKKFTYAYKGIGGFWHYQKKQELKTAVNIIDTVFDNVAISPSVLKHLDKVNQIKKYFPFYTEIEFSTTQYTELGDMIKQILFGKYFVNKIAAYNTIAHPTSEDGPLGSPHEPLFLDYRQEKTFEDDGNAFLTPTLAEMSGNIAQAPKNTYNILESLGYYLINSGVGTGIANGHDQDDIQNHVAYMRDDVADPIDMNEFNTIWKNILGNALRIKLIKTYMKEGIHRTYQDLLNGKPAYTEDIAYKIEKYAKKPGEGNDKEVLVQNIIIPNTSDINLFNYVDTQLRYGTDAVYRYKIRAIKIVFGCEYHYSWINHNPAGLGKGPAPPVVAGQETTPEGLAGLDHVPHISDAEKTGYKELNARVGVTIQPNIVMLEDLFYESPDIIISDHPPPSPDANVLPYRGKSDKILILLNGMQDTYRDYPIHILQSDIAKFEFVKKAQMSADGKITFSEDSPAKKGGLKFEIFRTKKKPMSYTDFELYDTISGTHSAGVHNAALQDKIKPNQKYYYTFRTVDTHGHISNPTEVYEVELIDDHGSVKPLIRIYNFEDPKYFGAIKECQKYLMVKPNLKQLYYNSEKDTIKHMFNNSAESGPKRRFKLRVTSKSTGKKVDININFSKKEVNEET